MSTRGALLTLLLCATACGERRTAAPGGSTGDAAAGATCARDPDCVGDWSPAQDRCASIERCRAGRCAPPAAVSGLAGADTGRVVFETPLGERSFLVELVDEPFETSRGLMCRREMRDDWGMLFLMPSTRPQQFWMKNTLIPLDMVFLDDAWSVVGVVADAPPQTLDGRGVDAPSRYVLELNGGVARAANITAGSRARFYPPSRD